MSSGVVIGVPAGRVSVRTPTPRTPLCLVRMPLRGYESPVEPPVAPGVCLTLGTPPQAFSGLVGESSIALYAVQLAALGLAIQSLQTDLTTLRSQTSELRRQAKLLSDWHDTVNSPWYRRVIWWFMGFRFSALGTWYVAPWNKAAGDKYNWLRTSCKD